MSTGGSTEASLSATDFLFRPQGLTGAFLAVMGLVVLLALIVAIARLRNARSRMRAAEADYRNNREGCAARNAPDAYLRLEVRPDSIIRILDAAPHLLLTLGILGTFLGLGLAVGQATSALRDAGSAMDSLQQLLRVVSFKFQTSAWGVILSLLFTAVVRIPAEELLESWLEERARALRNSQLSTDARMMDAATRLADQVAVLVRTVEHTSGSLQSSTTHITHAAERLGAAGEIIERALDRMVERVSTSLSKSNEVVAVSVKNLESSMSGSLGKLEKSVHGSQARISQALEDLARQSNEMHRISSEYQSKSTAALQGMDDRLGEFQERLKELTIVLDRAVGNEARAKLAASESSSARPKVRSIAPAAAGGRAAGHSDPPFGD